jgi:hypothetical protein
MAYSVVISILKVPVIACQGDAVLPSPVRSSKNTLRRCFNSPNEVCMVLSSNLLFFHQPAPVLPDSSSTPSIRFRPDIFACPDQIHTESLSWKLLKGLRPTHIGMLPRSRLRCVFDRAGGLAYAWARPCLVSAIVVEKKDSAPISRGIRGRLYDPDLH